SRSSSRRRKRRGSRPPSPRVGWAGRPGPDRGGPLPGYVLGGLVLGSIYAISALGLVLTYSSSRVVNFAHGVTAYAVAVFYHWLNHEQGLSIIAAAAVSLLVFSPALGLFLW